MIETKFKNTELGPIPEDWNMGTFADFLDYFSAGATPYRGNPSNFVGNIPWISSGELNYNRITDTNEHISEEGKRSAHLTLHQRGTFLIAITGLEAAGTRGRCAFVETPATTNQSCLAIKSTDKLSVEYLFWFYRLWSDYLAFNFSQGSKQQSFTADIVRKLPLYAPTLSEQIKIAEALTDVDALLSELSALIEKKQSVLKATMQELLTARRRLPGFSVPWEEVKLGDFVSIVRGGSPRPIEAYLTTHPDGLNWIKIGDTRVGDKYITHTAERIIPEGLSSTRQVHKGDLILSNSMSFGRPYILAIDGCIHDGWLAISEYEESFDTDFFYYLLQSEDTVKQYKMLAAGSGVLNLNKAIVGDLLVFKPKSIQEQRAIAEILSDMDAEIVELEAKREKYKAVRQGMMQQLLTGKIRLI